MRGKTGRQSKKHWCSRKQPRNDARSFQTERAQLMDTNRIQIMTHRHKISKHQRQGKEPIWISREKEKETSHIRSIWTQNGFGLQQQARDLEVLRSRRQAFEILKTNEFQGKILYKLSTTRDGKMDISEFSESLPRHPCWGSYCRVWTGYNVGHTGWQLSAGLEVQRLREEVFP